MNVTSQMPSSTSFTPSLCPAITDEILIFFRCIQMRPHSVTTTSRWPRVPRASQVSRGDAPGSGMQRCRGVEHHRAEPEHGRTLCEDGQSGEISAVRDFEVGEQSQGNQERTAIANTIVNTAAIEKLSTGAGEGNRTLVCSLGSCRSTIELRPQSQALVPRTGFEPVFPT